MSAEAINPILVEVFRGHVLESFHRGVVCIVNERGEVVFSRGNIHQLCYPRSAMKLLQVIPLLLHGGMSTFGFDLREIAVMCGSHNAESDHLDAVRSILRKINCTEADLACGAQYPTSKKDADELTRTGNKPSDIHNNCSGKHAGMLALSKLIGADPATYLDADHPVQKEIKRICALFYEYPEPDMHIALDGCSAPIFSIPVYHQAIAYKNVVSAEKFGEPYAEACHTIIQAISKHPHLVAGTKRYCTDMMQVTAPRVIGKTGAEGIFCMSFVLEKLGVCIKIDDGKMQPQYHVAQSLLEHSGIFSHAELEPLHDYAETTLSNFNKKVTGVMRTYPHLFNGLPLSLFH